MEMVDEFNSPLEGLVRCNNCMEIYEEECQGSVLLECYTCGTDAYLMHIKVCEWCGGKPTVEDCDNPDCGCADFVCEDCGNPVGVRQ